MRALFLLLCLALTACAHRSATKSSATPALVLTPAPTVIGVPRVRYVPIEEYLTAACAWVRDGALADMPEVARGRKRCLDFYEANLREIRAKQGAPADAGAKP